MTMTTTRTAASLLLMLLAARTFVDATDASEITCGSLTCENSAVCVEDSPDFESHRLPDGSLLDIHSGDYQVHCVCAAGWTGVACDVAFESCQEADHTCYHGGNCIRGLIDMYDNDQYYCNCDDAVDADGTRYVGKYCEEKAMTLCPGGDTSRFCLNDGTCNAEYPMVGSSCICSAGFKGAHCEYQEMSVPDCSLDCQNGGECILGVITKDYLDRFAGFFADVVTLSEQNNQYCQCPSGYYGQFCEIMSTPCGDDKCYHGSQCFTNVVNGETLHHCDCRYSNSGAVSYAGQFCQYKATAYCDQGTGNNLNGHLFCVNNGTCKDDVYLGCECPQGYRGFSCEYFVAEDLSVDSPLYNSTTFDDLGDTGCTLNCNSRGVCRDGAKDMNDTVVGDATHLSNSSALANQNFEHCVCEDGWTGLQCEYEATECAGGTFYCFHGGQCYADGNKTKCNCATASSNVLGTSTFGGDQCEHPATDICTKTNGSTNTPSQGLAFCVNYGTCKAKVDVGAAHPGCKCDETKWTGPHCEIKVVPPPPAQVAMDEATPKSTENNKTPFGKVMLVAFVFVILTFVWFTCVKWCKRRSLDKKNLSMDQTAVQLMNSRSSFGGYRDEPSAVNLQSRRRSDVEHVKTANSSRDPFASHLVAPLVPATHSSFQDDDGPQVYLGPPQDEDGHVLHSVEII